ncbi:MAG: NUDIX domain-containing protein [Candidatus Pacebacteria bacterium]|nr:NUDIX domain-containing protein [Candidatus Paceibacterota bacterium]
MNFENKNFNRINVAALIVDENSRFLICKRSKNKKFLPGIWHFPGGKVEKGESNIQALQRELIEEINIKNISEFIDLKISHEYIVKEEKHKTEFYFCKTTDTPNINNEENEALKFILPVEVKDYINDRSTTILINAVQKVLNENQ